MTGFFAIPVEPTEEQKMEAEHDLALIHQLLDGLTADEAYAFSVILAGCISAPQRTIHYHGQVTTIMRMKHGLCTCGSLHKAIDHGKATAPKEPLAPYEPSILAEYEVSAVPGERTVRCRCSATWVDLNSRMVRNKCDNCGAGPEVN